MMAAQGLDAFSQAGLYSNHADIGPRYAGVLLGLSNTAGVLAGVLGTAATGYILKAGTWDDVWAVAVGLYLVGTVVWNLFATGERIFDWVTGGGRWRERGERERERDENKERERERDFLLLTLIFNLVFLLLLLRVREKGERGGLSRSRGCKKSRKTWGNKIQKRAKTGALVASSSRKNKKKRSSSTLSTILSSEKGSRF
jgi:hypothetical protein